MTPSDRAEIANIIAETIASGKVDNKWELLNSWGPAVAVPVICLVGLAFAVWRSAPKLVAWFENHQKRQQEREDQIRDAYLESMREMTCRLEGAIANGCAMREEPDVNFVDDQTAKFRRRASGQ